MSEMMRDHTAVYPPISQILSGEPGTNTNDLQIVEQNKPLSQCILWTILENYYRYRQISAWDDVPSYGTNNRVIGEVYAELLIAVLLDVYSHLNPEAPIYILEPAAGTGCFSAHFLEAFLPRLAYFKHLSGLNIQYILSDFSDTNFSSWAAEPRFQPFLNAGILHFAVFNPVQENPDDVPHIQIAETNTILNPQSLQNPLMVIANYFFDSIRADFFMTAKPLLQEVQLTFFRELTDAITPDSPLRLRQLRSFETLVPVQQPYYREPRLNRLLADYGEQLEKTPFLFPIGALNCIQNLQALSNNQLILLSTDKGTTQLADIADHLIYVPHGDGFSFYVNYHAIQEYFRHEGAQSFQTQDYRLITNLNILLPGQPLPLEHTRYIFEEKLVQQNILLNHCDGLYIKAQGLAPADDLKAILAYLKHNRYEPMALFLSGRSVMALIPSLTELAKEQLTEVLNKIQANLFQVKHQPDLWAAVGAFYYHLGQPGECLKLMETSIRLFGMNSANGYYQRVSQEALNQPSASLSEVVPAEPIPDLTYFHQIIEKATLYTA